MNLHNNTNWLVVSGVDRLQFTVERDGIRWYKGSENHTEQTVETGRPHVQQVTMVPLGSGNA